MIVPRPGAEGKGAAGRESTGLVRTSGLAGSSNRDGNLRSWGRLEEFCPFPRLPRPGAQQGTSSASTFTRSRSPFASWQFRPFKVVVEATASYVWFVELVEPPAEKVVLANPKKLRVIAESTQKTDRLDAQVLTEFLVLDMIPESYQPTPRLRQHRALVRHRQYLQGRMTSVRSKIRHILSNSNADRKALLPIRRRSPVDRSLVARGARRQWLQGCLPDGYQPQCPPSPCYRFERRNQGYSSYWNASPFCSPGDLYGVPGTPVQTDMPSNRFRNHDSNRGSGQIQTRRHSPT